MKRIAIITAAVFLMASAGYAPCVHPRWRHIDYWQFHVTYSPGGYPLAYHTLDGQCDTDCSGNTSCSGDTTVDDGTEFVLTNGECDEVCDPPPM